MTNFNEKINSHKKFVLCDIDSKYFIERIGSMERLKLEFDYISHFLESSYLLVIQYKDTYRVQKMSGRCFMWSCTSNTKGGFSVRNLCLDRDGNEDLDNFGNPRFEYISGAVLISDKGIYVYGDTWFETAGLEKNHILCKAYVCGRFVSEIRIPAEAFDHFFGLKDNFPKQYEKQVETETKNKCEQAVERMKPVKIETKNKCEQAVELIAVELINEVKRNIESCMNLLDTNECQLERAMDAIKMALMDIEDQKFELIDMLAKLDDTLRKLK